LAFGVDVKRPVVAAVAAGDAWVEAVEAIGAERETLFDQWADRVRRWVAGDDLELLLAPFRAHRQAQHAGAETDVEVTHEVEVEVGLGLHVGPRRELAVGRLVGPERGVDR